MRYTRENDDFTKEEANESLKNNNFARQELKEAKAKARPKALNS